MATLTQDPPRRRLLDLVGCTRLEMVMVLAEKERSSRMSYHHHQPSSYGVSY